MPSETNCLIIVKGQDKTDSIASYTFRGEKCDIVYKSSPRVFCYNRSNIQILKQVQTIDPKAVICKAKGRTITDIDQIQDYGTFFRIARSNRKDLSFHKSEVELQKNCLYEAQSRELFDYFKETASTLSLKTDNGVNILQLQYDRISAVAETTVLAKYLNPGSPVSIRNDNRALIYPFGLNQSQKKAVENAFLSQVSMIQGPPGTGKTQTILNILANAVLRGKTVAVVSNNNSATQNVAEKLEKNGLSFLTAFLGSLANKEQFLQEQTGTYPDMGSWILGRETMDALNIEIHQMSEELTSMLDSKNRIAQIEQELLALKPEQFYFEEYYKTKGKVSVDAGKFSKFPSGKLLTLWLEYENKTKKPGFLGRILIALRFGRAALTLFDDMPEETIPFLQEQFYHARLRELSEEKCSLEAKLSDYRFDVKMDELRRKSMILFKAELARRYNWRRPRPIYEKKDFRGASEKLTVEYPVILSTTYSIKGTLSPEFQYDYLIIDEASQVDLATGVLALSCTKNVIIVGDQKQLPNVLTREDIDKADDIWGRHKFDERYHFSTHSLLASAAEIWYNAPSVLLKEHYRCHPKIAAFFNQKFYNGELIIMTKDQGEEGVLTMYRTAPGNHARGHYNQRQIDTLRAEVLPALQQRGFTDIGIITPYRDQVSAIQRELGKAFDIATVHKFQGREKEAIVLVSVDNIIGEFVDDPNMLNVAVSRAVKSLSVVISGNEENAKTNYGDLEKYIAYNNLQIVDSKVYSVFDLLYKGYYGQRMQYLRKHKRISEYDSENLMYSVIEKILNSSEFSKVGCIVHSSLATLVKNFSVLTTEESQYASNPLTHLDFLLFNKMDKSPVLAIEVDGTKYHAEGSHQAERDEMKNSVLEKCGIPILRIRTNESGEEQRVIAALREALYGEKICIKQ